MNTVTTVLSLINRASIPARLWINGSFLTEDPNPGDFSATLVLVESVFRALSPDQREFFNWFRTQSLFEQYRCDNYGMIIDADRNDFELLQKYWMRQCRFDRGRKAGASPKFWCLRWLDHDLAGGSPHRPARYRSDPS